MSLESIEGVVAAHSLHIWSLTVNKAALAVHLAIGQYSVFFFADTYSKSSCISIWTLFLKLKSKIRDMAYLRKNLTLEFSKV